MNFGQTRMRLVQAGTAFAAVALIAGCGSNYRSVVTPITSTGPAAEATSYLVTVSAPSPTTAGVATIIDYSGDTVMVDAQIGPSPLTFTMDETGSTGYTVNSDGTLTNFPVSTTRLQAQYIEYTTLASTAQPIGLFSPSNGLWAADLTGNTVDLFSSSPATLKMNIPVAPIPVMVIGPGNGGQRNFAISQVIDSNGTDCNSKPTAVTQNGIATPVEVSTDTLDPQIPLGKCPVYAVPSSDGKRLFVLNRGSDTISVINILDATADACTSFLNQAGQTVNCHPTLPLSTTAVAATGITPPNGVTGMTASAGPVFAEYNSATSQLIVANYDGGTISIIDVSLDQYGNDSATFGTTYTVPVGKNPAAVTVLYDGSRAYTANQGDFQLSGSCTVATPNGCNGTVTIVNLTSHTVEKTLPVVGAPRSVVSTQNSTMGKVYASSPNSNFVTVITTTTDLVDTTIPVEGFIVDVKTTSQNGNSGNDNNVSRKPGYGQPCFLPDSLSPNSSAPISASLTACQTMPVSGS